MPDDGTQEHEKGWAINHLWHRYENTAMHFNDLLMRLRSQALAAVAAISALIGLFGRDQSGLHSWGLSSAVFFFLCVFWLAIWIIDFRYYNRLLLGAVDAIVDLEKLSQEKTHVHQIDISTKIERAVAGERPALDDAGKKRAQRLLFGPTTFYRLVFLSLLAGLVVSLYKAGLIHSFFQICKRLIHLSCTR